MPRTQITKAPWPNGKASLSGGEDLRGEFYLNIDLVLRVKKTKKEKKK